MTQMEQKGEISLNWGQLKSEEDLFQILSVSNEFSVSADHEPLITHY